MKESIVLKKTDDQEIIRITGMENLPKIINVLYDKYHGKYQSCIIYDVQRTFKRYIATIH